MFTRFIEYAISIDRARRCRAKPETNACKDNHLKRCQFDPIIPTLEGLHARQSQSSLATFMHVNDSSGSILWDLHS